MMKNLIKMLKSRLKVKLVSLDGFSLVELLITLGIFGILMAIVTSIIIINLKAAQRIKARSYAREESSFMLNVLKKDVRNAEIICSNTSPSGWFVVTVLDESGTPHTYRWIQNGTQILREEGSVASPCNFTVFASPITYRTPSDVEFDSSDTNGNSIPDGFELEVTCDPNNCFVKITTKAWTIGMPGDSGVTCGNPDKQCITKEVAVSTRNFIF